MRKIPQHRNRTDFPPCMWLLFCLSILGIKKKNNIQMNNKFPGLNSKVRFFFFALMIFNLCFATNRHACYNCEPLSWVQVFIIRKDLSVSAPFFFLLHQLKIAVFTVQNGFWMVSFFFFSYYSEGFKLVQHLNQCLISELSRMCHRADRQSPVRQSSPHIEQRFVITCQTPYSALLSYFQLDNFK